MAPISLGERLAARYLLLEELGAGGMGVVYRARDEVEGRDVAIKLLRSKDWEITRRLKREARATTALDPRRIASVYDVGETPEGETYLVMEYVAGTTLRALLRRGRLERREALRIVREVAIALGEAHRSGLVHRDVKPDNIIVAAGGRVVLLDFGIVKELCAEEGAHLSTQLTSAGALLGTPAYLAPEQALGHDVGPEVDQFALGVMAFEMLTGALPWKGTDVTAILAQILAADSAPAPSAICPSLSAGFDAALGRALAKDKKARFPAIEGLADALEAAERGEPIRSPAADTHAIPPSSRAAVSARTGDAPQLRRRRWRAPAMAALALVAAASTGLYARTRRSASPTGTPAIPDASILPSDATIGCPIFDVHGVPDIAVPLGAAAASFACERSKWYIGGRDDRVLPPASLLDVPTEPSETFADPYESADVRAKTLDRARVRAAAYLDGAVAKDAEGWLVNIAMRAANGATIAEARGRDAKLFALAVKRAVEATWSAPRLAPPRPVDPDIARWTSIPDLEVGLADTDRLELRDAAEACATLNRRAGDLRGGYFWLASGCRDNPTDAGLPALDESSPAALVASARAVVEWHTPITGDDTQRIAAKLDDLRAHEASRFGRAALADAAGRLWAKANESQRAHVAFLAAVSEDPLLREAWQELDNTSAGVGVTSAVSSVAAAWFPTEPRFLQKVLSTRGDELQARLRQARLAYVLDDRYRYAMMLGRALAEAGRPDEARAVVVGWTGDAAIKSRIEAVVETFIDLHDARIERAFERRTPRISIPEWVTVASVLGTARDASTKWATTFLAEPDAEASPTVLASSTPIALCMEARRDLASRCLDRVAGLGHAARNWWGEGGDEFLQGARRYAVGDVRGAVAKWRPLVAGPTLDIVRVLPTEAFAAVGEPDLAARIDARKMAFTFIAGVSEAAPREAERALAAGDKARAKELAQKIITAWEVADVTIPAVAKMRALLKSIDR